MLCSGQIEPETPHPWAFDPSRARAYAVDLSLDLRPIVVPMDLNSTEEIIEELRAGRMVVIMDDEDRENEGDLLLAADCVTPEAINFMAKFGRGLICSTLTKERCERLRLSPMVNDNQAVHSTAFTVSIEAAAG